MSETFKATSEGYRRLKKSLSEADENTKYAFAFWCIGLALMGGAIIIQFGWAGLMFCNGVVLYAASGERKARRIGRESAGAVYLLPLHVGAFFVEAWLDALRRAQDGLPRWPGSEGDR